MENDDESRKDARISQRDQKVLATLYDSRRLDWNDPIEVKRSVSGDLYADRPIIRFFIIIGNSERAAL
jgi:hypothetical protein